MKLKCELGCVEIDDETIAVPVGDSAGIIKGVLRLNEGAAEIIDLLKEETTEESITEILCNKYSNSRDMLAGYVHNAVSQLRELGFIDE